MLNQAKGIYDRLDGTETCFYCSAHDTLFQKLMAIPQDTSAASLIKTSRLVSMFYVSHYGYIVIHHARCVLLEEFGDAG
jgi:hypothetical protein